MKIALLISWLMMIQYTLLPAQNNLQNIKGRIMDKNAEIPLVGATVELQSADPVKGATTDADGYFIIENVFVGRHKIRISYLGYNTITIPDILLTSGKEMVLNIGLEESVIKMNEIVVTADVEKDKANNEMAAISARSFTLEEVTRFSGGRNDASRMAANFAGVLINNDSRNDLIIRGNSPLGVLWRLEGVAIPNPNHFATLGTTGGPVSALNTNLLSNSDFLTGAFPSEYGNANAGVFDIQFRNGNKDKYEFTAQLAAFSGVEFMAEGPLNRSKNGSFLIAYRRSFVELAQKAGLDVGTTATPAYQDISFKLDFGKSKLGRFTLFGIGGNSDISFLGDDIESNDAFADENQDSYATSEIGIIGLTHLLLLNSASYLKTSVSYSTSRNDFFADDIIENGIRQRAFEIDDVNDRLTFNTIYNHKFNARHTFRAGMIAEVFQLNTFGRDLKDNGWVILRDFDGSMNLYQFYAQSKFKFTDKLTLIAGLHSQLLDFNDDFVIEPRTSLNWQFAENKSLSLGLGVHHQMLPLPVYLFASTLQGDEILSNRNVHFLRNVHYVIAYDQKIGTDWRIKSELYYQDMNNVPVESQPSSFSLLNVGDDFGFPETEYLVNKGMGSNYGIELTIEKFFSKGYYTLITGSLYDSKYQGSDGIKRSTAFNNSYILNVLGGKEIRIGNDKRNALTFDMKFTAAGGRHFTPIDLTLSRQFDREIKREELAYSERFDPYLRMDLKFGFQLNSKNKNFSQQFYLDFQNITNNQNVFLQRYNRSKQEIDTIYQIGFFPDILYRIQF